MNRRQLLVGAPVALLQRYATAERPRPTPAPGPVARLVSRLSYGARPGDLDRARAMGAEGYLEEQLHPESIPNLRSRLLVRRVDVSGIPSPDLLGLPAMEVLGALRQATLVAALTSERQLHEVMVELWSDHFSIHGEHGRCGWMKVADDREIRRHALGSFRDLLRATLTSPAMLVYLDGERSSRGSPNENHARELLELHTVGLAGAFTQDDVHELARLLSGWRIRTGLKYRGLVHVDSNEHDDEAKVVLGRRFEGSAEADLEALADLLAAHPATARAVARRLGRRFVGEGVSPELVATVARVFQRSNGDLRQTLGTLLRSPELLASPPLLKRPYTFALSSLRAYDARSDGGAALQAELQRLGQIPFGWATPDGYPEDDASWQSTLTARFRFAHSLAHGRIEGTRLDLDGRSAGEVALDLCRPENQYR